MPVDNNEPFVSPVKKNTRSDNHDLRDTGMRDVTVYLVGGGEIICQDVRAGVVKLLEECGARTNRVDFRAKPKRIRVPVSGEIVKNTSQAQSIVCQAIGQLAE
ncbi:hypothetical protein AAP_04987 [Ascosphaera apis ARSEF 7405]|uniref:Uncharacterized protein n=1 Tax=Ascosphaera apis ARSEF 7405 TaxID=392613 RepID=A0A167W565_9EURO|nr:hypothetical protein AAP_04987 [Ascosphaera apis ARSEF 7405]